MRQSQEAFDAYELLDIELGGQDKDHRLKKVLEEIFGDIYDDDFKIRWAYIILNIGKLIGKIVYLLKLNNLGDGNIPNFK